MVTRLKSYPYYVPNLRAKKGELDALARLSPYARWHTVPLIDFPKPSDDSTPGILGLLSTKVCDIKAAWGTAEPFYIDLARYDPVQHSINGEHPLLKVFELIQYANLKALPVTGTIISRGPGSEQIEAVSKIAIKDGRGLAIKLLPSEFSSAKITKKNVANVIELLKVEAQVCDVILDFEAFDRLPESYQNHDSTHVILSNAIDSIARIGCRSIVVCGSSVPGQYTKDILEITRHELNAWKMLQLKKYNNNVVFGDYGVIYPFQPDGGFKAQPPCRIRLSNNKNHILYRSKPNTYDSLRKHVLGSGVLNTMPDCWGKKCIEGMGNGFTGTGNATNWVEWDTNLHIEQTCRVIQEISNDPIKSGDEVKGKVSWPYLQNEIDLIT